MPSIIEFAERVEFIGGLNKRLYPRQQTLLKLMFLETENMTSYDIEVIDEWREGFGGSPLSVGVPKDVWEKVAYLKDRGYPHFSEVLNISGRRASKGHIGGIAGAYKAWYLINLDNPQEHYGISQDKELYTFVLATQYNQARDFQFADLKSAILNGKCFQPFVAIGKDHHVALRTPYDIRMLAEKVRSKSKVETLQASIHLLPVSSNSPSARGAACFQLFFDEFAHMLVGTDGPRTADKAYEALTPSLDQMDKDKFIYVPTSPYTKAGKAYELYQSAQAVDENGKPEQPTTLVVQLPSWELYRDYDDERRTGVRPFKRAIQKFDEDMERIKKRDPQSFKVEREAQWAEVIDNYLNPQWVDWMFEPFYDDSDIPGLRKLERQLKGVPKWVYWGHSDPSKAGCNFAFALGHNEPVTDDDGEVWQHVIIDHMKVWKPEDFEDGVVPYNEIEKEIVEVLGAFPTTEVFTYDQFGSFVTVARMKQRVREQKLSTTVRESTFTDQTNKKRAEVFKAALSLRWVHSYKDNFGADDNSLLEQELKFLTEKNGKVYPQTIGPVQTKDLADCVMEITYQLVGDQWAKYKMREELGKTKPQFGAQGGYNNPSDEVKQRLSQLSSRGRNPLGQQLSPTRGRGLNLGRRSRR